MGLLSLLWFLVRVIPKPSRAAYPCQRAALPLASSFVVWVAALLGSAFAWRKSRRRDAQLWKACLWGAAASWSDVTDSPVLVQGRNTVTNELLGWCRFYRLIK